MSYRVEAASTGRAACTNKECKDNNVKIAKGELRFGSWVDYGDGRQSWKWRHWGCVTPQILQNFKGKIDDDDDIDGWDELDEETQAKIGRALEQDHIDDEDWKGVSMFIPIPRPMLTSYQDPECNRFGARGFRVRTPKSKQKYEVDSDESPSETKPKRQRKRKVDPDEEDAKPARRTKVKKEVALDDEDEGHNAARKRRKRGPKKAVKAESDNEKEESSAPLQVREKKTRVKKEIKEEPDSGLEEAVEALKRKPGRPRKVKEEEPDKVAVSLGSEKRKAGRPRKTPLKEEDSDATTAPVKTEKRKPGRPKKNAVKVEEGSDDAVERTKPVKRGRAAKPKAIDEAVESEQKLSGKAIKPDLSQSPKAEEDVEDKADQATAKPSAQDSYRPSQSPESPKGKSKSSTSDAVRNPELAAEIDGANDALPNGTTEGVQFSDTAKPTTVAKTARKKKAKGSAKAVDGSGPPPAQAKRSSRRN
ncbi:MAG: hypothetical protein M1814_003456 [Vezdaea aestivalis]|nr:MAG: hypothetical protein M1814_003456 [Vezdaea aestivalis]